MLLPRLITAIIGIPLILLSVYWGGIPFLILMSAVVFLALREYFFLAGQGKYSAQPLVGTIVGLVFLGSIFLNGTKIGPLSDNQGTSAMLVLMLVPIFLREMLRKPLEKPIEHISVTFLGTFFIPWAIGHLILIRNIQPAGMLYIYFLFIVIWSLDTGAYGIGKRFGRLKLAETISPKKTIEGALGGTLCAVIVAVICRFIFLKEYFSVPEIVFIALIISAAAQFSDIAESLLKRDAGVKDSANLLPGHGGMLDRFDSFLFTAPIFYYYLSIFKHN